MNDNPHKLRLAWYGLTVFLSSAILLVLEITAGRLIAPYVGVTIYSWTSIIGVILAGLSLGNWLGGRWADRGADERSTGIALAFAAIFSLASLLALTIIAPVLQASSLNLVSASFLYVLGMFFIPSLLLGIPTPLLTTLALGLDSRTGHVVGRMHALAALGSIVGTFLTGFFLIQYFGSRSVIMISSALLLALSLPFLRKVSAAGLAGLAALIILVAATTRLKDGYISPCEFESSYFCLRVVDVSEQAPQGTARALVLDHLLHGINHQGDPGMLISPYVHLMQELVNRHFEAATLPALAYFFAGGGSYTQPRAIKHATPTASVTVAELDPVVTQTVAREMFVDPARYLIHHGDARATLFRQAPATFDVIVTDAFHDIAIPYHLVTLEYVRLAKSRLKHGGIFTTNVVDAFPDPKMVKSLMKTLRQEFSQVDVWLDQIPRQPQRMTYVISASEKPIDGDVLESRQGFRRAWFRINEPLRKSGTPLEELPVFTDDFVPVERMISDLLLTHEGL
ncbi:MAG: fused MFS/spermidine synthase [Gammaproteobacteria bacterium]|nr:fused MFS/spermidine synthase [Gammaproteobacteria bacterium]